MSNWSVCALHSGQKLSPIYCSDCDEMHLACQNCGKPICPQRHHYCDVHFAIGNIHECNCGAVVMIYKDGCRTEYDPLGPTRVHICYRGSTDRQERHRLRKHAPVVAKPNGRSERVDRYVKPQPSKPKREIRSVD